MGSAAAGRKETKQKIGTLKLNVSDVVRNGKIRDSWALQASHPLTGTLRLSLSMERLRLSRCLMALQACCAHTPLCLVTPLAARGWDVSALCKQ